MASLRASSWRRNVEDGKRRLLLEQLETRCVLAGVPVTAGLVLELDTEAGVVTKGTQVTRWLDQSGRNNHLGIAGGRPELLENELNGLDVIRFDGQMNGLGGDSLRAFPDGQENRTVFMVANYRSGAWSGFSYGTPANNQSFGLMVTGDGSLGIQGWGGANDQISTTAGRGEGWLTQSVVYQGGTTFHYRDGSLIDSDNHAFNTQNDRIRIGVELDDNRHIALDVAELLVYKRALSENQRAFVEAYLQDKYFSGGGGGDNTAPVAGNDTYTIDAGAELRTAVQGLPGVLDNDSDADNDSLSAFLVSGPSDGSLTLQPDGDIVYVHNGSSNPQDSFTYRATDGEDESGIATVTINVTQGGGGGGSNQLISRWHGDYYMHKWDSNYPGGSPKSIRENRWLRGGPRDGAQNSMQNLDLDGDGQTDDSRVYFDFSLTEPFNPPDTPARPPDGIYYHSELPGAQFYGGMSVDFFNYKTDRVQQAFIEDDGAGGDPADVGYPSPYLGPEYQAMRDYIEAARHPDGRYKKGHVGPQEDFAINIYRADLPHPIGNDNPNDNRNRFYSAFIWKKEDLLAGAQTGTVSLDADSVFSFESTRWWQNVGEARWILQSSNGNLYISEFSVAGAEDLWGHTNEFANPLSSRWAVYTPQADNLRFNANAANWQNSGNLFNNIQAVGLYVANDSLSSGTTKFSLDEIRFTAVVSQNLNLSVLLASALTGVDQAAASEDEPLQPSSLDAGGGGLVALTPRPTELFLSTTEVMPSPVGLDSVDSGNAEPSSEFAVDSAFQTLGELW